MINARDVCQLSKNMTSFIIFNRNLFQESDKDHRALETFELTARKYELK